MTFYKVQFSVDLKEIGDSSPIQEYVGNYDYWGKNSFTNIPLKGEINFDLKFPTFVMTPKSNHTDYLNGMVNSNKCITISKAAFTFFKQFQMDDFRSYNIRVVHKAQILSYVVLYFPWPRQDVFVDWSQSSFYLTDQFGQNPKKKLSFDRFKSFFRFRSIAMEQNEEVHIETLKFNKKAEELDLFRLMWTSSGFYVSAKLKEKITEEKLTGFRFTPVNELTRFD